MPRTRGPGSGYEAHVVRILISKGYYNIQRNIRKTYGELDIIAYKNGRKYLFEVKHRPNSPITINDIIKLARKAAKLRAIPVLVVSESTKFYHTALKEIKNRGIKVYKVNYRYMNWTRIY